MGGEVDYRAYCMDGRCGVRLLWDLCMIINLVDSALNRFSMQEKVAKAF